MLQRVMVMLLWTDLDWEFSRFGFARLGVEPCADRENDQDEGVPADTDKEENSG